MDYSFCVAPSPTEAVLFSDKATRSHCMCCTRRFHILRKRTLCFKCDESVCFDCIVVWQPKNQAQTQVLCKRCIIKYKTKDIAKKPTKTLQRPSSTTNETLRWSTASSSCSDYLADFNGRHGSSEPDLSPVAPVASYMENHQPERSNSRLTLSPQQLRAVEAKRKQGTRHVQSAKATPRTPAWHMT
ncbi:hypothetical protein AaE_012042 [Aphanomyces astaci]|uniref:FYVE-type domain-containing protein n=1 Tax=Aphanomyces astaci TaxID=112090 RepID=A0A6A4ZEQ0_APHAT|nr:hypothetical protein AaE_012042 [Aphanomyces astaci]